MTIGLLHNTIRVDEKLLITAAKKRKVKLEVIDIRKLILSPDTFKPTFNIGLERCISTVKGMHVVNFLEGIGVPVINNSRIAHLCEDKFNTSLALIKANIPTPKFALVFTESQVKKAVKELGGYPVVIKPPTGSWGRLLALANDEHALEAIIEHKQVLGSPSHKAFYLQEYIRKPGKDIRVVTVDNRIICAIYRESDHWITNTARGASALALRVDKNLEKICVKASKAVGGGVLGIDVFETDNGYLINEINHTTEFKNVQRVTGVDVAEAIIKFCAQKGAKS